MPRKTKPAQVKSRGKKSPKPAPDFVVTADVYNDVKVGVFRDIDALKAWCRSTRLDVDETFNAVNTNALAGTDTDPDGLDWFFAWIPNRCPAYRVCHECLHLA